MIGLNEVELRENGHPFQAGGEVLKMGDWVAVGNCAAIKGAVIATRARLYGLDVVCDPVFDARSVVDGLRIGWVIADEGIKTRASRLKHFQANRRV